MQHNKELYEPFIATPGMAWDHYLHEMRKVNQSLISTSSHFFFAILSKKKSTTWGGQIEIHAMGVILNVNVHIYSITSDTPTVIDLGYKKNILLCYYGNHYDVVEPKKIFDVEVFCQGKNCKSCAAFSPKNKPQIIDLIYTIVGKVLNPNSKPTAHPYKNIGFELWKTALRDQEEKDEATALKLANKGSNCYRHLEFFFSYEILFFFDQLIFASSAVIT